MRARSILRSVPLLLAVVAFGACGGSGHDSSGTSAPVAGAGEIPVKASSFKFDPKAVTVKAGQASTVALTSTDIQHDFTVDDLHIHISAGPGKTTKASITPAQPGTYRFYCSIPGHKSAGMVGTLVVQP